jgi:hypothetical protein
MSGDQGTETPDASEWTEAEEKTGTLLNDEITKRLAVQRESGRSVETKAVLVAGAALTAAQFAAGRHHLNAVLGVLTFVLLAITGGLAYASLFSRRFHEAPEPRALYDKYKDSHPALVAYHVALAKTAIFEKNREVYKVKAMLFSGSLVALGLAATTGAIARIIG